MVRNTKVKLDETMPEMGRPTKFTPERCLAIVDAISHRIPYELAAEANGICEKTLYNWMDIGYEHFSNQIDSPYADFLQAIKRAEMTKIREHSDMIAAKPERWQADAWILERRWPKHYGSNVLLKELNERMTRIEGTSHGKSNEERSQEANQEIGS